MQHASCICQFAGMCVIFAAIAVLGAEWQILPSPRELLFPGKRAHEESTAGRGKECESDVPGAVH